jgi:FkbM family methyltransferase
MNTRCLDRYIHTLRMLYGSRGRDRAWLEESLPRPDAVLGLQPVEAIERLFPSIRARLSAFDRPVAGELLHRPTSREVELLGRRVVWPILNKQGLEWYGMHPLHAYDFMAESQLGLHDGGKVFYDFGGHHGIWALYYALATGPTGRVYSFEPSVMNVEMSALLLLVNEIENVVNIGMAVGPSNAAASLKDLLVDFVPRESLQCVGLRDACWDRGDFLKMDVEGYEYDLLTRDPWIFDVATNMHIELHIPHLDRRGLDYRHVMAVIPFDRFDVFNHRADNPVYCDTRLSGFCGLMFRRRD